MVRAIVLALLLGSPALAQDAAPVVTAPAAMLVDGAPAVPAALADRDPRVSGVSNGVLRGLEPRDQGGADPDAVRQRRAGA